MQKITFMILMGLVVVSALSSTSTAGFFNADSAYCTSDSTGAGYCYGTAHGFRSDPKPNSRADFYLNHEGAVGFYAYCNEKYYNCWFAFPYTPQEGQFATFAGQGNTYFLVDFDSAGTCTYGYAYWGSDRGSGY